MSFGFLKGLKLLKEIIAENYLCFYALMEMILNDIGFTAYDQYKLANIFGVVVPLDYKIKAVTNITESQNEAEFGAHIDIDSIKGFFLDNNIPLNISFVPSNPYGEYPDNRGGYLIYALSYGSLYRCPEKIRIGHAVLKTASGRGNNIYIYDPGPKDAGIKIMSKFDIYDAMYDIRGGMYVFERTDVI